jgi:hypothetical protein
MRNETLFRISAVVFAALWTGLMWWARGPLEPGPLAILIASGALSGLLWYWLYGKWFRWYIGHH